MTPQYHTKELNEHQYGNLTNVREEEELNHSVNRSTAVRDNENENEIEADHEEQGERLLSNRSLIEETGDFDDNEYTNAGIDYKVNQRESKDDGEDVKDLKLENKTSIE